MMFGAPRCAPAITRLHAGVAQLVEQLIRNQQVLGSSPSAGSRSPRVCSSFVAFARILPRTVFRETPFDTITDTPRVRSMTEYAVHDGRGLRGRLLLQVSVEIRGDSNVGVSE